MMNNQALTEFLNRPIVPTVDELPFKVNSCVQRRTEAITLNPVCIGYDEVSGWTVVAEVHEDYYKWVNHFEASHLVYGKVVGDLESLVEASTEAAYNNFIESYGSCIENWDYHDI
jgi:hypothetical protein